MLSDTLTFSSRYISTSYDYTFVASIVLRGREELGNMAVSFSPELVYVFRVISEHPLEYRYLSFCWAAMADYTHLLFCGVVVQAKRSERKCKSRFEQPTAIAISTFSLSAFHSTQPRTQQIRLL